MAIPLHVHEYGPASASPLLAIHGVTGHGARWAAFAERQLAQYRVIAPDLRGHGHSTSLPPWTLEQHAADLLGVIDGYGLDAVPVMAHSFGGAVALHLHRLAPGRISKLVLLDPAVGLSPALALERAEMPQRRFANQREAWEAQRYDWPSADDETVYAELAAHLAQFGPEWRFRYCAPTVATAWSEMTRAPVLPHPGTPTMVVRALREQYVSSAFISGCQLVLGADFDLVDLDVGHMVYLERPADIGELVNAFVAKG